MSDEITGIPGICEYAPAPVDICIFRYLRFLPAWLSVSPVQASQLYGDILFLRN
jgi:hypothetical protein